ncbi:MAG: hypothetical protein GY861_04950, partial [bacterium]|nr:hypothetical protein [bacterium]
KDSVEFTDLQTEVHQWQDKVDSERRSLTRARMLRDISTGARGDEDKLAMLEKLWQEAAEDGDELTSLRIETEYNNLMNKVNKAGGGGGYGRGKKGEKAYTKFNRQHEQFWTEMKRAEQTGDRERIGELLNADTYVGSDGKEYQGLDATWNEIANETDLTENQVQELNDKQYADYGDGKDIMGEWDLYRNITENPDKYVLKQNTDDKGNITGSSFHLSEKVGGSIGPGGEFGVKGHTAGKTSSGRDIWMPVTTRELGQRTKDDKYDPAKTWRIDETQSRGQVRTPWGSRKTPSIPNQAVQKDASGDSAGWHPGGFTFGGKTGTMTDQPKEEASVETEVANQLGMGLSAFKAIMTPEEQAKAVQNYIYVSGNPTDAEAQRRWAQSRGIAKEKWSKYGGEIQSEGGTIPMARMFPSDSPLTVMNPSEIPDWKDMSEELAKTGGGSV